MEVVIMAKKEGVADALRKDGKYIVTCKSGAVSGVERIRENQHLLSLTEFIDLAREAGFRIDVDKDRLP